MTKTTFFLDIEWTDANGSELVSRGLVSEDGVHRFYAGRDSLSVTVTEFVRAVVYPRRLQREIGATPSTKAWGAVKRRRPGWTGGTFLIYGASASQYLHTAGARG